MIPSSIVACWADYTESEAARHFLLEPYPNDLVQRTTARSWNVLADHEQVMERCTGSRPAGRVLAGWVIWALKEAPLKTLL